MFKFNAIFLALILSITGFSFAEQSMNAEEMIVEAEQANAMAGDIGFEWRDTAKFIADAKTALADGKQELAFDLAQKAYEQAVLAKKQGEFMKANWQQFIPL
jgi:hypothetical protein